MSSSKNKETSNQTIRFLLDGYVHEVTGLEPTTTVLNYLREDLRRTGTKEGCAEGDCGACAVVVAEPAATDPAAGRVRFQTINSCIRFLPTLDGKALYTVESLKKLNNNCLHPVQQALVDCHGSQCGFCTPGFVMSLFALYKNNVDPTREEINDALAGNLCRCTGYRPIISAAVEMYGYGQDSIDEPGLRRELAKIQPSACLKLTTQKPVGAGPRASPEFSNSPGPATTKTSGVSNPPKPAATKADGVSNPPESTPRDRYFAPVTVPELAELLMRYPGATILAGGTDVGLWVTKQYRELPIIIYIGNVTELNHIDEEQDRLQVGASVSLTDAFAVLEKYYPDLNEIIRRFASPPIRNAATLCGNIANASPIGDTMPALISLGATLVLRRGDKVRELPLDEFYLDYQQKALQESEFVQAVRIPLIWADGSHFHSYKISKRYDQDISAVCGAYFAQVEDGVVENIRICYGGMAAIPKRARRCEEVVRGRQWNEATAQGAVRALSKDYQPLTDMRAAADYRLRVAGSLLKRFYLETTGDDVVSIENLHHAG